MKRLKLSGLILGLLTLGLGLSTMSNVANAEIETGTCKYADKRNGSGTCVGKLKKLCEGPPSCVKDPSILD